MKEKIIERLHEIEKKYDVKVLLAVESGSRAWGFASKDSDYDVRFVYIHRKNWYLSLVEGRDVIEEMDPDGILDFAGWDLKKALLLLSKCNSMFVEWLRSPVVYYKDCTFVSAVEKLSRLCFRRNYCMNHYYHMAVKHDERYLEKRGFELKRFMCYLRGLLAAKWAFLENDYPPVPFMTLVDAMVTDKAVHDELLEMVRLKSESKEHDKAIVSDKLIEYAAGLQAEIESALKDQKKGLAPDIKPLDSFFLEYVDQMDEAFDWEPEPNLSTMVIRKSDYEIMNRVLRKDSRPTAIIFVGIQGCGKTTFYRKRIEPYMKGWKHISMDEIHNRNKESALVQECIDLRLSFVIDNTNPTKEERKRYLDMLDGKGYRVMCYFFQSRVKDCIERNKLRGEPVPAKAIAATSNKLELPSKDEGFTDMVYIKVVPPHFDTELYVEETRTATFGEVLHQTSVEDVLSALKVHYKSSENDLDGYRALMNNLLGKKPEFSKYQISITHVSTDDEEYEHVSGVIPGDGQTYGIEFSSREQWLGMHLTEDTLQNYSAEDIIAHCLWEMTFFGFTDSEVQKKKDDLIESCLSEDGEFYTIEDGAIIPEDF
mgnify:CR=1 FL=1